MPERIDRVVKVQLDSEVLNQYAQLERFLILKLRDSVITASTSAVVAGKLQQFAQGAVYTDTEWIRIHDVKLEALEDLLEEANGKPVLVFYWYRHDEARISAKLKTKGITARILKTAKDISDWNKGLVPVLLAHPASAGHGLNLQAGGNIIVWFGLTWSLELYQQANARLYRQGQKESVIVHHLVAAGTIDEIIMTALESKNAGQEALLNAVKAKLEYYKHLEREAVP
jgi:SNF2 family DNA or RNA helicase